MCFYLLWPTGYLFNFISTTLLPGHPTTPTQPSNPTAFSSSFVCFLFPCVFMLLDPLKWHRFRDVFPGYTISSAFANLFLTSYYVLMCLYFLSPLMYISCVVMQTFYYSNPRDIEKKLLNGYIEWIKMIYFMKKVFHKSVPLPLLL